MKRGGIEETAHQIFAVDPSATLGMTGAVIAYKTQKRHCRSNAVMVAECISDSPLNLVGTEASGTGVHMARSTAHNRLNTLDIGFPSTVGTSVGVGNLDTKGNALATIITLSHSLHLLSP